MPSGGGSLDCLSLKSSQGGSPDSASGATTRSVSFHTTKASRKKRKSESLGQNVAVLAPPPKAEIRN